MSTKRGRSALSEETIKTALAARDEEKDRRNEEEEEDNALRKKGCGTGEEEDRKAGRRNEPAGENVGGPFVVEEASLKIIERDTSDHDSNGADGERRQREERFSESGASIERRRWKQHRGSENYE